MVGLIREAKRAEEQIPGLGSMLTQAVLGEWGGG